MGRQGELILAAAMAADMRSPNVSVTPINMEPYPPAALTALTNGDHHVHQGHAHATIITGGGGGGGGGGGVGGNEPPLDPSDAEVAQIDFQSTHVNMRSKKSKRAGAIVEHNSSELLPRPMSWEGELSDCERDHMCIDDDHSSQVRNFQQKNVLL